MTPEYLAGFFDGEGSVSTHRSNQTGLPRCRISLYQKDPEVLHVIRDFLGMGKVRRNGSHCHVLYLNRREEIRKFIRIVYPHAVVKRKQLKLAYAITGLVGVRQGKGSWSGTKYRDKRLDLYHQLKQVQGGPR